MNTSIYKTVEAQNYTLEKNSPGEDCLSLPALETIKSTNKYHYRISYESG